MAKLVVTGNQKDVSIELEGIEHPEQHAHRNRRQSLFKLCHRKTAALCPLCHLFYTEVTT